MSKSKGAKKKVRKTSKYNDTKINDALQFFPNHIRQKNLRNLDDQKSDTEYRPETDLPLKSINGRRCLTKCYTKGTKYVHPTLLTGVVDNIENSCAINPVHSKDPEYYKEYNMILADKCNVDDNTKFRIPDELESMLLSFYFDPSDFLAGIYELYSFDQVIYWTLENDYLPFGTIKRVHNCAWRVFGNKIDEISSGVLEYYYNIASTNWIKDYAKIIQNKYSFELFSKKNYKNIDDTTNGIYDILKQKFFTFEFFINSIHRYIYEHQKNWDSIYFHYGQIKKYVLQQLLVHIENILEKQS